MRNIDQNADNLISGKFQCRHVAICNGDTGRIYAIIISFFIFINIIIKAYLVWQTPINQDEFNLLSLVYAYERGELLSEFQTFHVHFFRWLSKVANNEVTQIIWARNAMFLLWVGMLVFLYYLGRYIIGSLGSLFAIFFYISLSYVTFNGASFRTDTIAVVFSIAAFCLFIIKSDSIISNTMAGFLIGLSCLITIKSAIHLSLFIPLAIIRWQVSQKSIKDIKFACVFSFSFVFSLLTLLTLHKLTLGKESVGAINNSYFVIALSRFLTVREMLPGLKYFLLTLKKDGIIWLVLWFGLTIWFYDLFCRRKEIDSRVKYVPIMFAPLLSILVYRNSYPYYYAFMMPTVTLICGYGYYRFLSAINSTKPLFAIILTIAAASLIFKSTLLSLFFISKAGAEITIAQKTILNEIRIMFPEPVPYIDGCKMVSSYHQVGFFMSTAGMKGYLRTGMPNLREVLSVKRPIFLLSNVPQLDLTSIEPSHSSAGLTLRKEDWYALRSNFVHHWGPVWVAGKQFYARSDKLSEAFTISIPGIYTVEADDEVFIDRSRYRPGETVYLSPGAHTVEAAVMKETIRLRWGDHLYQPKRELNFGRIFMGFFG